MENEQKQTVVDSLTAKSVEILDWLETSVKQTTDFVVEQTPQFIQELLAYSFWYSLIWFFISLIALAFAGRGLYNLHINQLLIGGQILLILKPPFHIIQKKIKDILLENCRANA